MKKSLAVALVCLLLFIINSLVYLKKVRFDNEVRFGSDSGTYHLMAVNFAKGYGFMKTGGVAGNYIQDYKYQPVIPETYQNQFTQFLESGKKGGDFSFYRAPGYPFFLGLIYKIFGVSPQIAKQIQLLLVVAIASFLPLIGYYFWHNSGLISGLIGMVIYLKLYARNVTNGGGLSYPNLTMAEPLIAIFLLLFIMVFIYWEKKKNFTTTLILGIVTGLNLLVKGSAIFVPVLTIVYLAYLTFKKTVLWHHLAGFIIGVILTILPWSIYASRISGQRIILSTQGPTAILESHNEYAIDGSWHREGTFHNQPEVASLSVPQKITSFYIAYPEFIPEIFFAKISSSFGRYKYLILALILINYNLTLQLLKEGLKKLKIRPSFNLQSLLAFPILALGFYSIWPGWFNAIFRLLTGINPLLIGLFLLLILHKIFIKKPVNLNLPAPIIIIFLSYLMIILASCGIWRYIQVIDFIFILIFIRQLLGFLKTVYQGVRF